MANWKKLAQGAAGAAGGGGLNVEDVFSTYLYTGNGGTQTITNGIDLSNEGGLVWIKNRTDAFSHYLTDTERGTNSQLSSDLTSAAATSSVRVTGFNADGFNLGGNGATNGSSDDMASWTFRKAPKFFDVVTYTGNSTNGRDIAHNLGSVPGCIIVKKRNGADDWRVYHRGAANKYASLNSAFQFGTDGGNIFGDPADGTATAPTSTHFTVSNDSSVNNSAYTYVAYLFAHNDGDGDFGPTGDQDIIKCGSYTGNSNGEYNDNGVEVNLGFEPQWILIKPATWSSGNWQIYDTMRGINARTFTIDRDNDTDAQLFANSTNAETGFRGLRVTPTGFKLETDSYDVNASIHDYIYVAIRRGPMAVPESATDVFTPLLGLTSSSAPPIYQASHTIDMVIEQPRFGDSAVIIDRLRGNRLLKTASVNAETGNASYTMDYQTGAFNRSSGQSTWYVGQCFRRAPSFFDVVTYMGTGSARTIDHSLNVKPDMMWFKKRNTTSNWAVWHKDLTSTTNGYILLDQTSAEGTLSTAWNGTEPTASNFSLGTWAQVNQNNSTFVCYLFASLDGVSKVGTYSGSSSDVNVDCGFSSGARFVLIKRINASGGWYVYDSARGIVSGNDPRLLLDETSSENTGVDEIDPYSSGFTVVGGSGNSEVNYAGSTYMFYAIA